MQGSLPECEQHLEKNCNITDVKQILEVKHTETLEMLESLRFQTTTSVKVLCVTTQPPLGRPSKHVYFVKHYHKVKYHDKFQFKLKLLLHRQVGRQYYLPTVEFMKFCSDLPSHAHSFHPKYSMYSSVSYHALTPQPWRFWPSILLVCHYYGFQSWANVGVFFRHLQRVTTKAPVKNANTSTA